MSTGPTSSEQRQTLTDGHRSRVLRIAALSIACCLTAPLYYGIVAVVPLVATPALQTLTLGLLGIGLFVVFPASLVYGSRMKERGSEEPTKSDGIVEYGVNDRWEQQNL